MNYSANRSNILKENIVIWIEYKTEWVSSSECECECGCGRELLRRIWLWLMNKVKHKTLNYFSGFFFFFFFENKKKLSPHFDSIQLCEKAQTKCLFAFKYIFLSCFYVLILHIRSIHLYFRRFWNQWTYYITNLINKLGWVDPLW